MLAEVPLTQPAEEVVELKEPALAAFLAWLVPGLGHWYQGRMAKAALYFVCIMGTFAYGAYLSSDKELGAARAVYFSWREADRRWAYACQVGVGLTALPALVQANRMANGQDVWCGGFMAPPRLPDTKANASQPTPQELHRKLHRYFELATVYTMVGGLLNILAIYDAFAGPVPPPPRKEDEDDSPDESTDTPDAA